MSTQCLILRTNRTMGRKNVKDSCDDFIFEDGTYFIRKEKVFLWKTSIRGKIKPTLLYIEGIADPLFLDNLSIKKYYKDFPVIDPETKKPMIDKDGKIKTENKEFREITDIFIDSKAIHNMTDKKILVDLSAQPDISASDIIIIILIVVAIVIGVCQFFV